MTDLNHEERSGLLVPDVRHTESREDGIRQNERTLKNDEHI